MNASMGAMRAEARHNLRVRISAGRSVSNQISNFGDKPGLTLIASRFRALRVKSATNCLKTVLITDFYLVFLRASNYCHRGTKPVIFAAREGFFTKSSRMYEPGSRSGSAESSVSLATTGVIASADHLHADMVKRVSHSQKTTFLPCVYSSYIRELFEENFE